eukprot:TRINITY_DN82511_c1_g1_i1.p1 TRINITY_DN82511_c1_g1~~TRINITY_DN82511_c1_g1_i1.p1  ORF type:complete len:113 (+),score=20.71 TRINITY_DN82511_c1_g1_i1:78-416(+)
MLSRFITRSSKVTVAPTFTYLNKYNYGEAKALTKDEITERVISVVSAHERVDTSKINNDSHFKDLGLDSLDTVEVMLGIENEFALEIPDELADKINSIPEAVNYLSTNPHCK